MAGGQRRGNPGVCPTSLGREIRRKCPRKLLRARRENRGMRKVIYEVRVRRENGDEDTLYVCLSCLAGTGDFLTVIGKKRVKSSTCDRCG